MKPQTLLLGIIFISAVLVVGCGRSGVSPKPQEQSNNNPPIAVLSANTLSGFVPLTVTLDASKSHDPDPGDAIVLFIWDFDGDGALDQSGTSAIIEHIYSEPETYSTSVQVRDRGGKQSERASVTIAVERTPEPPVASVSADKYQGDAPLAVTFSAEESSDPDGSIVLYEWDYTSDGIYDESNSTGLGQYTYSETGYYRITLRVTDNNGLIATDTIILAVGVSPWLIETVDILKPNSGWGPQIIGPSLAFDLAGNASISYVRSDTNISLDERGLAFAKREDGLWKREIIIVKGAGVWGTSLAYTPEGNPSIAFVGVETFSVGIGLASFAETSWVVNTVWGYSTMFGDVDRTAVRLAVGPNGLAAVAYSFLPNWLDLGPNVPLATSIRQSSGIWEEPYEHIDASWGPGAIAYDLGVNLFVAYSKLSVRQISGDSYERETSIGLDSYNGASWLSEEIDKATFLEGEPTSWKLSPSLAFDPTGNVTIAYPVTSLSGSPPFSLRYAVREGSSWMIETVGDTLSAPSLAYDSAGSSAIAYLESNPNTNIPELIFRWKAGSQWNGEVVDQVLGPVLERGDLFAAPSLAFDRNGGPSVVYYDAQTGELKYAWRVAQP